MLQMNSKIIWHSLPGIIWVSVIHTYTFSTFPWPTLPPTFPLSQREYSVCFHTVYTCISNETIFIMFIGFWCQSHWHVKQYRVIIRLRPFMSLCFVFFVLVPHKSHEERKERLMGYISSLPFIIYPSCFVIYGSYHQSCVRPCKNFFWHIYNILWIAWMDSEHCCCPSEKASVFC